MNTIVRDLAREDWNTKCLMQSKVNPKQHYDYSKQSWLNLSNQDMTTFRLWVLNDEVTPRVQHFWGKGRRPIEHNVGDDCEICRIANHENIIYKINAILLEVDGEPLDNLFKYVVQLPHRIMKKWQYKTGDIVDIYADQVELVQHKNIQTYTYPLDNIWYTPNDFKGCLEWYKEHDYA